MKTPRRSKKSGTSPSPATMTKALSELTNRIQALENRLGGLASVPDELKSVTEFLRDIDKELKLLNFWRISKSDLDAVKTELRLVRGDLAELSKRLGVREAPAGAIESPSD